MRGGCACACECAMVGIRKARMNTVLIDTSDEYTGDIYGMMILTCEGASIQL